MNAMVSDGEYGPVRMFLSWPRHALVIFLLLFSVAKFAGGYREEFGLSRFLFYVAAIIESLLALALLANWRPVWVAIGVLLLMLIGALWGLHGGQSECGCAGGLFDIDGRRHLIICSVGGVLASLVVQFATKGRDL